MPAVFRVLVVCTGNVCRSPQAAQLIRARLEEVAPQVASQVVVASAGTYALVGASMPHEAATLSVVHGGDPEGHVARQVSADAIRESDLVLTMAAEHRRAVVRLLPRASRYTFTLTEFAVLLESAAENTPQLPDDWSSLDLPEKLRNGVRWASARRGLVSHEEATPADVIDPYRRPQEDYDESARQIVQTLERTQRAAVTLAKKVGS